MQSTEAPDAAALSALADLMRDRRTVVLAGAGMSTESGIPDYRGPGGRLQKRGPIQYKEFVDSDSGRRRYWSRSSVGWPRMSRAEPNAAHRALAALERAGVVAGVITQNVDGLHQAAGSQRVVELHGTLARVRCLSCGTGITRGDLQDRLVAMNPDWFTDVAAQAGVRDAGSAPDGDAELPAASAERFRVPDCRCGGMLKPDVVFFGENVPRSVLRSAWELFEAGDALLVVGSSLTVFSGRRFVYRADKEGMPIGIATLGETRGDPLASVKVEGRLGELLPRLAEELIGASELS